MTALPSEAVVIRERYSGEHNKGFPFLHVPHFLLSSPLRPQLRTTYCCGLHSLPPTVV